MNYELLLPLGKLRWIRFNLYGCICVTCKEQHEYLHDIAIPRLHPKWLNGFLMWRELVSFSDWSSLATSRDLWNDKENLIHFALAGRFQWEVWYCERFTISKNEDTILRNREFLEGSARGTPKPIGMILHLARAWWNHPRPLLFFF